MRCAFTIIYEGKHHLQHLDFAEKMASMFDHWIVVEGHSLPYGSTKRCNKLTVPPTSQDGTVEFMKEFALTHPNVHFYSHGKYFFGKDEQVNTAILILKKITKKCFLWEVDADEHWKEADLQRAEFIASNSVNFGFSFQFTHYIAKDLIAIGEWGGGFLNRLWKWTGQHFRSHEPALLVGQRRVEQIEGVKFDHYSYLFDKDVEFKSKYYAGHQNVFKNIQSVRESETFPVPISNLFGAETLIGKSNSYIDKIQTHG